MLSIYNIKFLLESAVSIAVANSSITASNLGEQSTGETRVGTSISYFVSTVALAGAGLGVGWRNDNLAVLGIVGFGVFLLAQVSFKRLSICLLHGLITGYIAYLLANPWMVWTIENLMDAATIKTFFVVQSVHLLHGGMYFSFAGLWWLSRKWSHYSWLAAPAIWLILESIYPAMFPTRQACLIVNAGPLIQISSIFGVAGVSLQVFAIASLLPLGCLIWKSKQQPYASQRRFTNYKSYVAGILILTSINFLWGAYRSNRIQQEAINFSGEYLSVGLIQGDTEYASYHQNFVQRSRDLSSAGCDLVLWPECSLGKYNRELVDFSDDSEVAMNSIGIGYQFRPLPDPGCYLLGGGYSWSGQLADYDAQVETKYVSAFLIDPQENLSGRHDKIELMAGGEYVPFANSFPQLSDWLVDEEEQDGVLLSRGELARPIGEVEGVSIAALLCCEDMYPRLAGKMTRQGADLIVCLANGMAFNSDIALHQHFNISRFRAVENNRHFIRCGSYGVSSLVMPNGTVNSRLACFAEEDLTLQIPKRKRTTTIFSQLGDTLTPFSYLLLVILGLVSCWKSLRLRGHEG